MITTMPTDDSAMKTLLKQMFTGWTLHEESWNPEYEDYDRTCVECMVEACGGDTIRGNMLHLFDHWSNDIQSMAPFYGIELTRDADNKLVINENVPPAPSNDHFWDDGQWREMPADNEEVVANGR